MHAWTTKPCMTTWQDEPAVMKEPGGGPAVATNACQIDGEAVLVACRRCGNQIAAFKCCQAQQHELHVQKYKSRARLGGIFAGWAIVGRMSCASILNFRSAGCCDSMGGSSSRGSMLEAPFMEAGGSHGPPRQAAWGHCSGAPQGATVAIQVAPLALLGCEAVQLLRQANAHSDCASMWR